VRSECGVPTCGSVVPRGARPGTDEAAVLVEGRVSGGSCWCTVPCALDEVAAVHPYLNPRIGVRYSGGIGPKSESRSVVTCGLGSSQ